MVRPKSNLTVKPRKTLTLSGFLGVDLSSSPFNVSTRRAKQSRNMINEYGVNHKRHGWEEVLHLPGAIRLMIEYDGEILIHAGTKICKALPNLGGDAFTVTDITPAGLVLTDTRSQAFIIGGKVYFTGVGAFLVYGPTGGGGEKTLRPVYGDPDTKIPTTTISIDNDSVTTDTARAVLDDVNMLTPYRINQLVGAGTGKTWTLDGTVDAGTPLSVEVDTASDTLHWSAAADSNAILDENSVQKGTVDRQAGKITLTADTTPPVAGVDNIRVKFAHTVEGSRNALDKCTFGVLFGVGGNTDRLFLSGNPDEPNKDWFSEAEDPTYVSDVHTGIVGQTPIVGYARLNDATLAILKEPSTSEPTVFYRTGTVVTETDDAGNIESMDAVFPITAGAIGEGCVCRFASANLAGDNLVLTSNGVKGLALSTNIATNTRYARERSRNIDEDLKKKNLAGAYALSLGDRYYLAVDGVVYVADARHKFSSDTDIDGSFNYEWWYWDNIPAGVLAAVGGVLWFGTTDGSVCRMHDGFADRVFVDTDPGDLAFHYADGSILYNGERADELKIADRVRIDTEGAYALLESGLPMTDGVIEAAGIGRVTEGKKVFLRDHATGEPYGTVGTEWTVFDWNRGAMTFKLKDGDGNQLTGDASLDILIRITGREMFVAEIDARQFRLGEYEGSAPLDAAIYGSAVTSPVARIEFFTPVVAEWYTPILDLGTNSWGKTLLDISVTTEPEVNGAVEFGYVTRISREMMEAKGTNTFSFPTLDFNNFTFSGGFASSWSVPLFERNINYVIFRIRSAIAKDCAVSSIEVTYKINDKNKGVR